MAGMSPKMTKRSRPGESDEWSDGSSYRAKQGWMKRKAEGLVGKRTDYGKIPAAVGRASEMGRGENMDGKEPRLLETFTEPIIRRSPTPTSDQAVQIWRGKGGIKQEEKTYAPEMVNSKYVSKSGSKKVRREREGENAVTDNATVR